jgi:RNA polymerase sigma factor (sigma-70 family)
MVRSDISSVLQFIRGVTAEAERLGGLPDRELLQRFVGLHEEAAFAALMQRHGPMVLGVCRRVLRQTQDAEDAFQATFLLLARGAGAIRNPDSVGGWLHGVALRAASKLRSKTVRRPPAEAAPRPEGPTPPAAPAACDPIEEATWKELRVLMDEELDRLPPELRVPLVLCYLEGRTQDEGARQLGWTRRVFRRRLEKGRARLARGLARRGVALSTALFAVLLSQEAAAMTTALWAPVLRAAVALAGERAGGISAVAWRLAEALVPAQTASGSKLALALLLVVNLAATAVSVVAAGRAAQHPPDPPARTHPQHTPAAAEAPAGVELVGATAVLRGCVRDASGQPVPHARLTVLAQRPYRPGEHGLRQDLLVRGAADADGHFRLVAPVDFPTWYAERQVVVVASAPNHAPGTLAVTLRAGQAALALRLATARPLRGLLTDVDGRPVVGVRLEVVRLGSALREIVQGDEGRDGATGAGGPADFWPAPATTNARGEFELPDLGTVRNVWLQIQDDRFAVETFPAEFSDGRPIDGHPYGIAVVPGQVLEGTVTAADTGRPIPHARLTAVSPSECTEAPRYALHTGAREVPRAARGLPTSPYWTPWLHTVAQEATTRAPCTEFDARADADGHFRLRVPSGHFFRLEAHAPGAPYLALSRVIDRRGASDLRHLNFALPRGVLLTARVHELAGGPVAGAVAYYVPDDPRAWAGAGVLHGCDAHAISGADGRLSLAVPPGRGRLCVHAPDGNFLAVPYRVSGEGAGGVSYAHGICALDLPDGADTAEANVPLREGVSITGKVVGPDGRPVAAAVLVSARHVHPLNPATARPVPAVGGDFVLPGCEAGRTYRVLFLDAERRLGAVADLTAGARERPAVVRLQPCGQATVRFVGADGRPLANQLVTPFVLLEPDVASGDDAARARRTAEAVPHEMAWADPLAYRHCLGPHTEADGRITLTGLVPGARYGLTHWDGARSNRAAGPFTTRPGENLRLTDVTAPAQPPAGARPPKVVGEPLTR